VIISIPSEGVEGFGKQGRKVMVLRVAGDFGSSHSLRPEFACLKTRRGRRLYLLMFNPKVQSEVEP
jgi:hypothetical protein